MHARTFVMEPFDIMLHATEDGVNALQARFSTWLRTLRDPARFVCWQMPVTLDNKISRLSRLAQDVDDAQRRTLLMEYRRHYESLNDSAEYQRALCGMALWSEQNPRALVGVMRILERASGGGNQPEWLSSHPKPGNRVQHIQDLIAKEFPNGVPRGLTP